MFEKTRLIARWQLHFSSEYHSKLPSDVEARFFDLSVLAKCHHSIFDYGTYGFWGALKKWLNLVILLPANFVSFQARNKKILLTSFSHFHFQYQFSWCHFIKSIKFKMKFKKLLIIKTSSMEEHSQLFGWLKFHCFCKFLPTTAHFLGTHLNLLIFILFSLFSGAYLAGGRTIVASGYCHRAVIVRQAIEGAHLKDWKPLSVQSVLETRRNFARVKWRNLSSHIHFTGVNWTQTGFFHKETK